MYFIIHAGIQITHQSPAKVEIPTLNQVCPLYCVVSLHTLEAEYKWCVVPHTSDSLPCSPVIYTKNTGVYRCEVTFHWDETYSHIIDLRLLPSELYAVHFWCSFYFANDCIFRKSTRLW